MEQNAEAIYENGVLRPITADFNLADGQRVMVTVRPMEEVNPGEYACRHSELLRRLEADGALVHFPVPSAPSPADFRPLTIEGEPLSETIMKNRR